MFPRLEDTVQSIPSQLGSYLLWLYLSQTTDVRVGKLGRYAFPAGDYVYLGSAFGPGGLRARLGRHLRGDGRPHWHIDHLRFVAQVRGFGFAINCSGGTIFCAPAECDWSQKVATLSEAKIVAPGFGASDCPSGCAAHLVHFPHVDVDSITRLLHCEIRNLPSE